MPTFGGRFAAAACAIVGLAVLMSVGAAGSSGPASSFFNARGARPPALGLKAPRGPQAPLRPSQSTGFDLSRLSRLDRVIAEAIKERKLPGAVVVVGRGDTIVLRKAYRRSRGQPAREPMTLDTIFDVASLTKVVATTPAVMMLVEEGKVRLTDPVATFIPDFAKYGKDRITVRDLLTHMSGLRPDVDVSFDWRGYDEAIRLATEEVPTAPPGRRFVYSDINYFLLAEIVRRVSKQPFEEFVRQRVFLPLGMKETTFNPPASLSRRASRRPSRARRSDSRASLP